MNVPYGHRKRVILRLKFDTHFEARYANYSKWLPRICIRNIFFNLIGAVYQINAQISNLKV